MNQVQLFNLIWNTKPTTTGLDLDYAIKVQDGRVYLLFQGSTSTTDWLEDFKFIPKVYKDQDLKLRLHKGAAEVWNSAKGEVIHALIEACGVSGNIRPVIAGHSIGGAFALLAAVDFFKVTGRSADVVTYGTPKICADKRTAEYIKARCGSVRQYTDRNDAVPMLPPFFYHVNKIAVGVQFDPMQFIHFAENHCNYGWEEYPDDESL